MKNIKPNIFIVCLLLFSIIGCEQDPILVYSPPETEEVKLELYPKSAFIGSKLYIISHDSLDLRAYNKIYFPDSIEMYPDSIKADTMYVTVPFCTTAGPILISFYNLTAYTDIFSPILSCKEDICVTDWNLNYDLQPPESYYWYVIEWQYELNSDTVHLFLDAEGPHMGKKIDLYFKNLPGEKLPIFLYGDAYFCLGTCRYNFEKVLIKIYSWDINGLLAGRFFFTENRCCPEVETFWVETSK